MAKAANKSSRGTLRICKNGHRYNKSSDCPTCPVCEAAKKPATGFLSLLSAPARRSLENNGITTINKLAQHTEKIYSIFMVWVKPACLH